MNGKRLLVLNVNIRSASIWCQERLSKFQNVWLSIFSHNLDLHENISFVSARKLKAWK